MAALRVRSGGSTALVLVAAVSGCRSVAVAGTSGGETSTAPPTCAERRAEATAALQKVLASPTIASCTADTECGLASPAVRCVASCASVAVSNAGAAALADAEASAEMVCGTGCDEAPPPCPGGPSFVGCVSGVCTGSETPPPTWGALSMERATGFGISVPPACIDGDDCSLWTLTPNATVVVSIAGVMHEAQLSAADFQTVDAILRSAEFRSHVAGTPWSCGAAPSGPRISLAMQYSTETTGVDVTGCVDAGPAGNDPQVLFQVLSAY
jgi:hypothetical protein